jgi:hypothetical protein
MADEKPVLLLNDLFAEHEGRGDNLRALIGVYSGAMFKNIERERQEKGIETILLSIVVREEGGKYVGVVKANIDSFPEIVGSRLDTEAEAHAEASELAKLLMGKAGDLWRRTQVEEALRTRRRRR